MCPKEEMLVAKGTFFWPSTTHGTRATVECPRNPDNLAARTCLLDEHRYALWQEPDIAKCSMVYRLVLRLFH